MGLLRPGPRGPKVLRHDDVPGARSTRDGDTGNEDNSSFARFLNLTPAMRTTAVLLGFLNLTRMCRGHGVPEMVTPAMRTTAVLLGF